MPPIRILSEPLVNQIAAGEVIERPASVVKELLENAIDAQSTRVLLELEEAGKKLIRVSDDGGGMAASDVPLALASHATSKIASVEDLEGITTLGFRGEALASIASVADVRLVSRTADALEATEVTVSGSKAGEPHPTSGPVGTTVEVRNLFRYIPARRKFLKTDATEMGHITEQVTRLALAYPAVHLTVTHNGRSVYELPPTDSVRDRVARRQAVGPGGPAAHRPCDRRGPVSFHQRSLRARPRPPARPSRGVSRPPRRQPPAGGVPVSDGAARPR